MTSFMLITEGPTDQEVLKAVLTGYYGEEPFFPFLRPRRDATDESKQAGTDRGGWERVFEHCENSDDLRDDLVINDYLVIHVDTDVAERAHFGVPLTIGGEDRPETDVIQDVCQLLVGKLGEDFCQEFQDRILFAIAVHSLECWLLPLHIVKPAKDAIKKSSQTKSCEDRLEKYFDKYGGIDYKKDVPIYRKLAKGFLERANIDMACQRNVSFDAFIRSLDGVLGMAQSRTVEQEVLDSLDKPSFQ